MVHLTQRVAAKSLQRFVFLNVGPYQLEGGGVRREFMFATTLETEGGDRRIRDMGRMRVMNALES